MIVWLSLPLLRVWLMFSWDATEELQAEKRFLYKSLWAYERSFLNGSEDVPDDFSDTN